MKAYLDEGAIRIAYAAAIKEESRLVLQCVKIGSGEILACDGFMMARRKVPIDATSNDETILINAQIILAAHKMLKGSQLIIENKDKEFASITNEEKDSPAINVSLCQDKYPSLPTTEYETVRKAYVAIEKSRLLQLLKATNTTGDGAHAMKLRIREPKDPIEIKIGKTTATLMPYYAPEEGWENA
jgi:DNA polymerase III sliding clamp (beta) subunit (PCNA family)